MQYSICGLSGAPQPIAQYILNNLETSVPSQFGFLLQVLNRMLCIDLLLLLLFVGAWGDW